jgi:hypothetical protein
MGEGKKSKAGAEKSVPALLFGVVFAGSIILAIF